MSNLESCYDSEEPAGFMPNPTLDPIIDHAIPYQPLVDAQIEANGSSTDDKPPSKSLATSALDIKYLIWLKSTTLEAWQTIRKGPKSEQQHYRNIHFDNHAGELLTHSAAFGSLCQKYGPLHPMAISLEIEKGAWVQSYQSLYKTFSGSNEELLDLLAKAYEQTKKELKFPAKAKYEAVEDGLRTVSAIDKADQANKPKIWTRQYDDPYSHPDGDSDDGSFDIDDGEDGGQGDYDDDLKDEHFGRQGYGGWD